MGVYSSSEFRLKKKKKPLTDTRALWTGWPRPPWGFYSFAEKGWKAGRLLEAAFELIAVERKSVFVVTAFYWVIMMGVHSLKDSLSWGSNLEHNRKKCLESIFSPLLLLVANWKGLLTSAVFFHTLVCRENLLQRCIFFPCLSFGLMGALWADVNLRVSVISMNRVVDVKE